MDYKKQRVLNLHLQGKRPCEIIWSTKAERINERFIYRILKQFKDSGIVGKKPKGGSNRTVRTPALIKRVREQIWRNPNRSVKTMSTKLQIPRTTLRRILKEDLGLKAYRKQRVHGFSEKIKAIGAKDVVNF